MKNAKQNNKKIDALVASLMPDSDKKMGAIAGTSLLVALALCFWAAAYDKLIDDVIFEPSSREELKATINMIEKKEVKKEEHRKPKKVENITRKRAGGGGKPKGRGNPRAPKELGVLKQLTAMTQNASASVYDLMSNQKFAKDIDKVLSKTTGFKTTGNTRIGERHGKVDGAFNDGVAAGGSGGIEGAFDDLFGGSAGKISTKALKGHFKEPSPTDIDFDSGSSSRSASEIMKVVRMRTPGLRHIYNKFLKKNPGFQGKVTLKFSIAPGGEVISIAVVSSTTGYAEFDNEVKKAVARWTFNKIKSGNTTVTIPFTFTE